MSIVNCQLSIACINFSPECMSFENSSELMDVSKTKENGKFSLKRIKSR